MYDERPYDHGFDEPDRQFLFQTTDEKRVELVKVRSWFYNDEYEEMDFEIFWQLHINGSKYRIEETDRDKLIQIAMILFEEDTEATEAIQMHINEMIHESKMLGEY